MPEFLRGNSVAYLNPAPPLDPKGASEYAISPPPATGRATASPSFLREYNRADAQDPDDPRGLSRPLRPARIQQPLPVVDPHACSASGTFAEGWAVYTEQMMLDQGFGDGDLKLRASSSSSSTSAPCVNAILDHEMHAGDMTDDEALDLLMGRAFQTEGEAVGKIIRAKQSSAQLSTYFVGRTAFYRLRQSIQRELGDRFDLGRYHEAVLSHGTLPVKYLDQLVRKTLASEQP